MDDNREEQEADEIVRRLKAPPVQPIPRVIMPMIRRVIPDIIASEIIGVQPMVDSTAEIFTMKYKFDDDTGK